MLATITMLVTAMHTTQSSKAAATTRRAFCSGGAAALLLAQRNVLRAQVKVQPSPPATPTRPDVAAIDRDRILTAAQKYLNQPPAPLTSLQCARSPGTIHDYYSEAEPDPDAATTRAKTPPFTAHRDALFSLGLAVPALAAAYFLTGEDRYAGHAGLHLRAWFVDPATRMAPSLDFGQVLAPLPTNGERITVQTNSSFGAAPKPSASGSVEGILETLPLVEIAQAIPFLATSPALSDADRQALNAWFAAYLHWLTAPQDSGPRLAALARDRKDHHGASWLLQVSAYTMLTTPEGTAPKSESAAMDDLRHRFRTVTLRAQISSEGTFPHELGSATPYRNSLFNLDMLAGICQLLSTRFESVWDYQLEDGPGMRAAIAYHFPFIADRKLWPFRADSDHFDELPGRRASLLFTARAYQRPEYATLWKTLPPDPPTPGVLRTLPIHQPLLWVRQPPRV
jgi:hypothetical protein